MAYWLFKSEPNTYSWDDMVSYGAAGDQWDGVRNHQAKNQMLAMEIGDLGFFYHSVNEKQVVGVVEVIAKAHPDTTDDTGKWMCVDVKAVAPFPSFVTLAEIKARPELAEMILVKNSRLSVQPVTAEEWGIICAMGGYSG